MIPDGFTPATAVALFAVWFPLFVGFYRHGGPS